VPKFKNDLSQSGVQAEDDAVQQKLERLKKEYADLHTKKITTAANIHNLEETLRKLRESAAKDYGTSDIDELQRELARRRQENKDKVEHYEKHITEVKKNLAGIDNGQVEEA
jgi:cell division protein FtsB